MAAEGLEELAELEHFRGLGRPLGQGLLFARPADALAAGEDLHFLFEATGPAPVRRPGAHAGG